MVTRGAVSVDRELARNVLHGTARVAIHDAAFPRHGVQKGAEHGKFVGRLDAGEMQVGPVVAGGEAEGFLQFQHFHDILAHAPGGGGREGPHRGPPWQPAHKIGDAQVAGTEVLSPLGHAMRLVHGQQRDARILCKGQKGRHIQPLRGHVDDAVRPGLRAPDGLGLLAGGQAAVNVRRRHARCLERHDLVLHQRDQRRNHQRDSLQHQRGQLVAHGLARARGHHAQHVVPAEQLIHQLLLPFAKALVAEHALEYLPLVHRRRHPLFQKIWPVLGRIPAPGPLYGHRHCNTIHRKGEGFSCE